jgi:N6-adenosine-specific RNA methylase IME4
MTWPFGNLQMFGYDMIVADPPWSFELYSEKGEKKSAQAQYDCMSLDDIKRLPVSHLAAPDCCLFMWATWPMLPQCLEVLKAWGFRYVTGGHWHKLTASGKQAFGTGYRVRCASEPWFIGLTGNPTTSRSLRNAIEGVVREHSRKPEEAYTWAEQYIPNARRVELFSRQERPGWEVWGNESQKFNASHACAIGEAT